MQTSALLIFGAVVCFSSCFAKLPADIELCKAEDVQCIARVTTGIIQSNPKGRSDLGIPPLDPFRINSLVISQGATGALNLDLSFKNIDIVGFSNTKIDRAVGFTKDPHTSKFEMYASVPKLSIRGKYKASGRILLLPITGDGDAVITMENVKLAAKYKPIINEKDGHQYLDIDKIKLRLEPKKVSIRLTNLFNGDKTLGENMNAFLNENWRDVWTELAPSIDTAIAEVCKSIMVNLFKKFSYDGIYAD